jgi:hypothetical protein
MALNLAPFGTHTFTKEPLRRSLYYSQLLTPYDPEMQNMKCQLCTAKHYRRFASRGGLLRKTRGLYWQPGRIR